MKLIIQTQFEKRTIEHVEKVMVQADSKTIPDSELHIDVDDDNVVTITEDQNGDS